MSGVIFRILKTQRSQLWRINSSWSIKIEVFGKKAILRWKNLNQCLYQQNRTSNNCVHNWPIHSFTLNVLKQKFRQLNDKWLCLIKDLLLTGIFILFFLLKRRLILKISYLGESLTNRILPQHCELSLKSLVQWLKILPRMLQIFVLVSMIWILPLKKSKHLNLMERMWFYTMKIGCMEH